MVVNIRAIEEDGRLVADLPDLGNSVAGYSLPEVKDACLDLIAVLWEEYAMADDDTLTRQAQELKARLNETYFKERVQWTENRCAKD